MQPTGKGMKKYNHTVGEYSTKTHRDMNKTIIATLTVMMLSATWGVTDVAAQPKKSRVQQNKAQQKANTAITTRAQISFPTSAAMDQDVVWRRDIYREINLMDDENAGLYYPAEPAGNEVNLFTYIFKLMLSGKVPAYEYRLDGNEVFNDSARVKPLALLDNYHIFYERVDGRLRMENSDIPSREVKSYYIKESAYYDQANATFHKKVIAICPVMAREDDFGDGTAKYPLFWMKYDDLAPFLSGKTLMTSSLNNAAVMSADDYFTRNMYKGEIYKTNNMLGRTLAQYCTNDSALKREQKRIEDELIAFEKNLFGDQAKKDSLDSIAKAKNIDAKALKKKKSVKTIRRGTDNAKASAVKNKKASSASSSSSASSARVSVRRQRR